MVNEIYKHGIKYRLEKIPGNSHKVRVLREWTGYDGKQYQQWVTIRYGGAATTRYKIVHVSSATWIDSNARKSVLMRSKVWARHAADQFRKGIR